MLSRKGVALWLSVEIKFQAKRGSTGIVKKARRHLNLAMHLTGSCDAIPKSGTAVGAKRAFGPV